MAKSVPLCHHVKVNGVCCESPALRDQPYCYFHASARERSRRRRQAVARNLPFQLPILEDAESIQVAIGDVLNALLSGQIDHKTAGLLLYGLQTAASNVRDLDFSTPPVEHRRYDRLVPHHEEISEPSVDPASQDAPVPPANLPKPVFVRSKKPRSIIHALLAQERANQRRKRREAERAMKAGMPPKMPATSAPEHECDDDDDLISAERS